MSTLRSLTAFLFCIGSLAVLSGCATTTSGGSVGGDRKQLLLVSSQELDQMAAQSYAKLKAEASAQQLLEEAKAGKFKLAVAAFGSGEAFNQWVFATGLPEDIQLQFLYAGEGTFWTDLKGFTETMLGKQTQETRKKDAAAPPRRGN